jgi:Tfp pilus assembly protein PilX
MKSKRQDGMILAIVLLCVSIMVLMIYVLSQIVVNQQKSTNNYADIKIAENYAKAAMFEAESRVYYFDAGQYTMAGLSVSNDLTKNLESPTATCCNVSNGNILARRLLVLKNMSGSVDLTTLGQTCNTGNAYKGICYKTIGYGTAIVATSGNSDQSWQPWTLSINGTVKPCSTYTATSIPMIEDSTYRYSWRYSTGNSSLCSDPRMIVEPISLDFHGNYALSGTSPVYESDTLTQNNLANITLYQVNTDSGVNTILSPRLYRITVVAFGRNGDTKVTLQELVLINNYDSDLRFSGDIATNLAQRIIRISTRWIR